MTDQQEVADQPKKKKGGRKMLFVWALAALPLTLVLWPTCIVMGASLVPTLGTYFVDTRQGRHLTICIGLMNAVGAIPALGALWDQGQTYQAAVDLLADGLTWLTPYAAAAGGYLIYFITDSTFSTYYRITSGERIRSLQRQQKKLIEEWGPDVVLPEFVEYLPPPDDEAEEAQDEAVSEGGRALS